MKHLFRGRNCILHGRDSLLYCTNPTIVLTYPFPFTLPFLHRRYSPHLAPAAVSMSMYYKQCYPLFPLSSYTCFWTALVARITVRIRLQRGRSVPSSSASFCNLLFFFALLKFFFSKGMFLIRSFNSNAAAVLLDALPGFLFKKAWKVSD